MNFAQKSNHAAPKAARRPHTQEWHGVSWQDDYAWLRAENWRAVLGDPQALDEEILSLLQAEKAHSEEVLAGVKPLRAALFADLKSRIAEEEDSPKRKRGDWLYWTQWRKGTEYPAHLRCRLDDQANPQVLLDQAKLAEGAEFFRLLGFAVAPKQDTFALVGDFSGQEQGTLLVRAIADSPDAQGALISTGGISNGDFAFTADGTGLYYVRPDADHRPSALWLHRLGTPASADELIWQEDDPAYFVALERLGSSDQAGGVLLLHLHDHAASEYRILSARPADSIGEQPQEDRAPLIFSRNNGVQATIVYDLPRKRFLALREETSGAEFRLDVLPAELHDGAPRSVGTSQTLLAVQQGRSLLDLEVNHKQALVLVNWAGKPGLGVLNLEDDTCAWRDAPEPIGALSCAETFEYLEDEVFFWFSAPRSPPSFWRIKDSAAAEVLWQKPAPNHEPQNYVSEECFYPSADGTLIPVQLLRRKEATKDNCPTLLYGYGAYGIPESGHFSLARLALVDLGIQHAAARIRGGDDLGRHWYRDGKLANKENSFNDFIAVAGGLIDAGRTAPDRLAIHGGSAGGLLVGAVLNRAPALFQAALAVVPFVDMLNTILDETLPLTPPEWREWGNPRTDKEVFLRIQSYAPYENVAALPYPWLLATAGISDPRVTYWEPLKWVQKIRSHALDSARGAVLLDCNLSAGHGGASGRYQRLQEVARDWAFLLFALGRAEEAEKLLQRRPAANLESNV